jgi:hypothetical protein
MTDGADRRPLTAEELRAVTTDAGIVIRKIADVREG